MKRPGCKESPKALSKHAIQDQFLMVNKFEPTAFAALQDLFDDVSSTPKRELAPAVINAQGYFKCLNSHNFGSLQLSGNGAQYNGEDRACVDWDYHGQCYASDENKYPPSVVTRGLKTKAVADHKEIYKRKPFCKYADYDAETDTCTNPQSLVVIEMRESTSPIVTGSYNGASGGLDEFLATVQKRDDNQRQSAVFSAFIESLIRHGN